MSLVIRPLAPALADDYLAFFDHERGPAFSDNPEWARCYCQFYHVPKILSWGEFTAAQNRVAMRSRIEVGEMEGFLAYERDEVVGWLNAQPRHKLPHCFARLGVAPPPISCEPEAAAVIVCFVVAPRHRRRGVSRSLLNGAIEALQARGFALIDAFPFRDDDSAPAAHYHGALPIFLEAGFTVLSEEPSMTVVRRSLR